MGKRFFLDGWYRYIIDRLGYMLELQSAGPARLEHVHKIPRARGFNQGIMGFLQSSSGHDAVCYPFWLDYVSWIS